MLHVRRGHSQIIATTFSHLISTKNHRHPSSLSSMSHPQAARFFSKMNSHALNPSIYQPLNNPSQEIRLLKIESQPKLSPEKVTPVTAVGFLSALLSPPPPETRAPIKCRLFIFKLDDAPPYKALSYTWGSPGHGGTIQVDGQDMPVRQNLFTALQRLHQESWVEYLWADALCINQSNDDEKSHQVPLMGQIYSQAETVIVWLGEELGSTEKAFSFIRKSCSYGQELREMVLAESELTHCTSASGDSPQLEVLMREKLESLNDDSNKQAMDQVFGNPYWTRVWVLQEFGHAASSVLICGRQTIDMSKIHHFLFFWKTAFRFPLALSEGPGWNEGIFSPLQEFLEIKAGTSTCQVLRSEVQKESRWKDEAKSYPVEISPAHSDIFTLFVKTRRYMATDIRDKIYALLNLVPPEHRVVEPNYCRSEADLYRDLVTNGITHYNSLYCISMGGVGTFEDSACPNLPSWLPDFSRIGNLEFPYACPIFMVGVANQHNFDASGSKNPVYSISDKHLTARGFSFDKIVKTTQLPTTDTLAMLNSIVLSIGTSDWEQHDQTGIYRKLYRAIFPNQLLIEPNTPFVMGSASSWAAEKKLASGFMFSLGLVFQIHYFSDKLSDHYAVMVREGHKPTMMEVLRFVAAEDNPALSYLFSAVYEEIIMNLIPDISGENDTTSFSDQLYNQAATSFGIPITEEGSDTDEAFLIPFHKTADSSTALTHAKTFLDHMQYLWASRAFAITEGGYMGFVRPGTRVGDELCILYGCPSPLVIRPDEGEYLLVGDCCFEGMMRGEMVKKQEEGEFVLQNFIFK